jgi:hypothetical protein
MSIRVDLSGVEVEETVAEKRLGDAVSNRVGDDEATFA